MTDAELAVLDAAREYAAACAALRAGHRWSVTRINAAQQELLAAAHELPISDE